MPGLDWTSLICSSDRCYHVDGHALSLCQRCLGLYVGALVTAVVAIAAGRRWRRMPSWPALGLQVVLLFIAAISGIHLIDFNATWRTFCGFWTGFVIVRWLWAGIWGIGVREGDSTGLPNRQTAEETGFDLGVVILGPAVIAGLAAGELLPASVWWGLGTAGLIVLLCVTLGFVGSVVRALVGSSRV